jgi:hypothetical protein
MRAQIRAPNVAPWPNQSARLEIPLKPASASFTPIVSMMYVHYKFPGLLALAVLHSTGQLPAQHVHLNAGALSTTPGSPLNFVNGDGFVASSGYVFNMVLRTNGPANGLYDGSPTFTAAGSDGFEGPPAAPGSQLALVVKSLTGPENGTWAFWESLECNDFGASITFSLASGATNGTNRFLLSQNSGLPGEDPYGHCHGRRFTVAQPGLYTVGVQIVDVSTNGPGGGPIHTPSRLYFLQYQAGATISRFTRTNTTVTATFGTRAGSRFYLEASPVLDNALDWTPVAGPFTGDNRLQSATESGTSGASPRFYRLRVTTP